MFSLIFIHQYSFITAAFVIVLLSIQVVRVVHALPSPSPQEEIMMVNKPGSSTFNESYSTYTPSNEPVLPFLLPQSQSQYQPKSQPSQPLPDQPPLTAQGSYDAPVPGVHDTPHTIYYGFA